MDKNIKREPLYQLWAETTKTGELIPVPMFPRAEKEVVEEWANTVRMMIASGKEKRFSNPQVLLHMNI